MRAKYCDSCYYAHINCSNKRFACDQEDGVCSEYMSVEKIEKRVIDEVLEIIDDSLYRTPLIPESLAWNKACKFIKKKIKENQKKKGF